MVMSKHVNGVLVFAMMLFFASGAAPYEVDTHVLISDFAYDQWSTRRSGFFSELSLDEDRIFVNVGEGFTLRGWLREGSRHEDDLFRSGYHFYDPVFDRGLTIPLFVGVKAPDWAFEQPTENLTSRFSWTDARRALVEALVATTPQAREAAMAQTFRSLGDSST